MLAHFLDKRLSSDAIVRKAGWIHICSHLLEIVVMCLYSSFDPGKNKKPKYFVSYA